MRAFVLIALLLPCSIWAQRGVVSWASGPFGTPDDPAYVIERDRIHIATGPFGDRGRCLWLFQGDEVFRAVGSSGFKGPCAYVLDGNRFLRSEGTFCSKSGCVFEIEQDRSRPGIMKVHHAEGAFCNRVNGGFVIEGKVVYLAEGPFCNKADALLVLPDGAPLVAVLAILAGL